MFRILNSSVLNGVLRPITNGCFAPISSRSTSWRKYNFGQVLYRQSHNDAGFVHYTGPVYVWRPVMEAIKARLPVVALESTIITHGMKYPDNLQTANRVESIIRERGALPATIGIINGTVFVGLQQNQLEQLAQHEARDGPMVKVSRGDLSVVCQKGWSGGTTVSATSYLANLVGIRVFVTGGIGGVHRGAEVSMDISADLTELSRTPITVVSAGIKSILDIGKTLEVLETNGVCVAVYNGVSGNNGKNDAAQGPVQFPAFFTADSGISVNYNFETSRDVAQLIHMRDQLKLDSGILLAVPNRAEEGENYQRRLNVALEKASAEMRKRGIHGKHVTPYLLSRISQLTGGESLTLNQRLIENNARVGAQVAVHFSQLLRQSHQSSSNNSTQSNSGSTQPVHSLPVVIGGSIYDIVIKADSTQLKLDGSTYSGTMQTSLGGVGRNIADAIGRLGQRCLLITAVGADQQGQAITTLSGNLVADGIRVVDDLPTSTCVVTIDGTGECVLIQGDLRVHHKIDSDFVSQFREQLSQAPIVITDANIPKDAINYVLSCCRHHKVPVWHEPTDLHLVNRLLQVDSTCLEAIKFLSPNLTELVALHRLFYGQPCSTLNAPMLSSDELIDMSTDFASQVMRQMTSLHAILVTIGKHGIVYVSKDTNLDSSVELGPNSSLFELTDTPIQSVYMPQDVVDQVVNVSGAGDCLVAGIVYGLIHQRTVRQSLELGLRAAQLSVSISGTVPLNLKQIL